MKLEKNVTKSALLLAGGLVAVSANATDLLRTEADADRLRHYKRLVTNIFKNALNQAQPIKRKYLAKLKEELAKEGDYFVLCHRKLDNDKVQYENINSLGAVWFSLIQDNRTIEKALELLLNPTHPWKATN